MPPSFRSACAALVPPAKLRRFSMRFDLEVFVSVLCCMAEAALDTFSSTLRRLFPDARLIKDVTSMGDNERVCLMIADVKNPERIREKIKEAAAEHEYEPSMWPFVQLIGDLLRASVVARCFDTLADAWSQLEAGFDVRDGHGRLKNNLWTEAERPPDVLINLLVVPPAMPPIVAEVQLHLREILVLKESALHRLYEVSRAHSIDALQAEAKMPRRPSLTAAAPEIGDDLAWATAGEIELVSVELARDGKECAGDCADTAWAGLACGVTGGGDSGGSWKNRMSAEV